jgi:hypothetical protein
MKQLYSPNREERKKTNRATKKKSDAFFIISVDFLQCDELLRKFNVHQP